MPQYRLDIIQSLARQLSFAPMDVRHDQIAAAETLLYDLDPAKSYPSDFVIFRITGYDPKASVNAALLTGLALQHDLGLLVEQVSAGMAVVAHDVVEPVLSIDDVTARFNVTSKTIQRWRRRGLVSRRFVFADGKLRVGFLLSSIERFVARNADVVADGSANMSHVGEGERLAILRHARRLAIDCRCSEDEITRRLARRFRRSALTILHTVRKHDEQRPADAIFVHSVPAINAAKRVRIVRRARRGMSLKSIARRAGHSRSAVYRVIMADRVERLTRRKAKFHDDELYHGDSAQETIESIVRAADFVSASGDSARIELRPPRNLPPYLADLYRTPLLTPARERALFLQFNFRKFAFVVARRQLDPERTCKRQLDQLEGLAGRAAEIKNQIVRANLRLVVNVARKHLPASMRNGGSSPTLMELVSEGNIILMRAVEGFDLHRNVRFSTYATLALMKGFARLVPTLRAKARGTNHDVAVLSDIADRRVTVDADRRANREEVARLLGVLSGDERRVIALHYGLDERSTRGGAMAAPADRISYAEMGRELGLSKHHVRQIEQSALDKLRAAAGAATIT